MKTKIIPFDLETAKKIQAREIKGKINTRDGQDVSIILWDKKDEDGYIILALIDRPGTDLVVSYTCNGETYKGHMTYMDLILEVPDNEPQFKPFDKVLVRDEDWNNWNIDFFGYKSGTGFMYLLKWWKQCVLYAGNEYLVGTSDNPKEI